MSVHSSQRFVTCTENPLNRHYSYSTG